MTEGLMHMQGPLSKWNKINHLAIPTVLVPRTLHTLSKLNMSRIGRNRHPFQSSVICTIILSYQITSSSPWTPGRHIRTAKQY